MNEVWVICPICGEDDMPMEIDEGFSKEQGTARGYIKCLNLNCASNGGTNRTALSGRPKARPLLAFVLYWLGIILFFAILAGFAFVASDLDQRFGRHVG